MIRLTVVMFVLCVALIAIAGCSTTPSTYPPRVDLEAVSEAKPVPPITILTDPAASELHASRVEGWGDRIHSAGLRLCRYFERTGMDVDCD